MILLYNFTFNLLIPTLLRLYSTTVSNVILGLELFKVVNMGVAILINHVVFLILPLIIRSKFQNVLLMMKIMTV